MKHSLEIFLNDELIFYSDGKWLHPLFEFEEFLQQLNCDSHSLIIKDKIVGRAAALLQVYFGITTVKAGMMSQLGKEIFDYYQVNYEFEKLVDRIQCRTEEMLKDEFDPEKAYQAIKDLIKK